VFDITHALCNYEDHFLGKFIVIICLILSVKRISNGKILKKCTSPQEELRSFLELIQEDRSGIK